MVFTSVTPTDLTKVFAENVKTTVYFYNASNWSGVGIHGYNKDANGQYTGDWNTSFMEKEGDTEVVKMRKLYETPEILVTKFDVNKRVMVELETGNEKPGDKWNAGVDIISGNYDNPDLDLLR